MEQSDISRRGLIALTALLATPGFSAMAVDRLDPVSGEPTKPIDVAHRLTVQVKINGAGPYAFMVDTGANASVISSEIASALKLPSRNRANLHSIAGVQSAETVLVEKVTVGRRERRRLVMSVLPTRTLGVAGILGLDWLGSQGLILDYAAKEMRLGSIPLFQDGRTFTVPTKERRSGLNLIEASIPNGGVLAFLDTGSTTTVGNMALLDLATRGRGVSRDWAEIELRSVTGQSMKGRLAALRNLTLGKMILRNVPVVFGPVHTFEYWGLTDRPAILIGSDVLGAFESVALDFIRGQVHFRVHVGPRTREAAAS